MLQSSIRALAGTVAAGSLPLLASALLLLGGNQPVMAGGDDASVEAKVAGLISKMTLDEKILLLSGTSDGMHVPGIKRLGIPQLKFSDGPVGVRCWGRSTAYPAGAMLAATFDSEAAYELGRALGRDSRARGVHVLLGPGVDLYRVPQCGRNFEYFGEDPFLSSRLAVGYVKGVQSQKVATSVKHYCANDQEVLRDSVDTIVDERRLHEICLPPFKAAVQEANAWTLMAAYNKVNGEWCTANSYLLTEVLRKQWGFKGVLMSDWGAVHEFLGPFTAGTDLEMGTTTHYTADNIKRFLQEGKVSQDLIDEKVRRMLRMSVSLGFFDNNQEDKSIPANDPSGAQTALKVAREGLVLLKNERELLPLNREKIQSLVVLGPNAGAAITGGGGSSGTEPFSATGLLDAVASQAGKNVKVTYMPSWLGPNPSSTNSFSIPTQYEPAAENGQRGMKAEYFSNPDLAGKPEVARIDSQINYMWGLWHPADQITTPTYSVRWTGKIKAAVSDNYVFACASDGARVLVDGKPIFDNWSGASASNSIKTIKMEAGETHDLVIEYHHLKGVATMMFAFGRAGEPFNADESRQIAEADAVVAAVGFNSSMESEGYDRPYDLPAEQVELLKSVSRLNPRTVVVLNAGGNVGMEKWIDGVAALFHAWYPGQNGNQAVAEALFGDLNPSGKLPDTFEKRFEDSPAFGNYPGAGDNGGKVEYKEGIYVGYRWFDKKNITPRFPFGYGLSYTSFLMHDLVLEKKDGSLEAKVEVTNTGKRAGTEVVQLYVRPLEPSCDRPVQELKGILRVELNSGETKTVTLPLKAGSFATYDAKAHEWISPAGQYEIAVGSSSRNIHCSRTIKWDNR
jgi:beta-glucosidase